MTGSRIEGYLLQYSEVSSSSDVLHVDTLRSPRTLPFISRGRRSYRNPTPQRHSFPLRSALEIGIMQRPVIMPNHVPADAPAPTRNGSTEMLSTRTSLLYVLLIFCASLFAISLVYANFPKVTDAERQHIRVPWNIDQAKQLGIILNRYKDDNYLQVLVGVFVTYIFLQTFAIPGSLFLSILSGFLFPFMMALILVCTCSAVGASLCFLLSQLLGRKLVLKYFPERASKWAVIVNKQRDNLFNYVVFLRVTPFLPNWFINLTAPVIGVPLKPFALGTFVGVAPPSFVAIQAGQTLHTMSSTDSAFSWTSVMLLAAFAVVSLVPIFLKQRLKDKFE